MCGSFVESRAFELTGGTPTKTSLDGAAVGLRIQARWATSRREHSGSITSLVLGLADGVQFSVEVTQPLLLKLRN